MQIELSKLLQMEYSEALEFLETYFHDRNTVINNNGQYFVIEGIENEVNFGLVEKSFILKIKEKTVYPYEKGTEHTLEIRFDKRPKHTPWYVADDFPVIEL